MNSFPEEQQANAYAAMLVTCRISAGTETEPISPPEYHAVIRALDNHGLPAVAIRHMGQEARAALQQAGFDERQIQRIAALATRDFALKLRTAEWEMRGITSVAHCQDQYPAQLRKLDTDAPPVVHLMGNQELLDVPAEGFRPVLTEWAMSPRADSLIAHVAAEIVELNLTLAVSTAHQAGRRLLEETVGLGGQAVAVVDGAPLQEITRTPETRRQLESGNLLLLSSHDPDVRVRSSQHRSQRMILAMGGDHVDLRTGRKPRATIQRKAKAVA